MLFHRTRVDPVGSTTSKQQFHHELGPKGGTVGISEIVEQIDREIAQLQQVRALLAGKPASPPKKAASVSPAKKTGKRKKKRNLTPEGRKRIAEAVRRRWAEQKKAAGKS
jgi:hypothetical protein